MQFSVELKGIDEAIDAMIAAFPSEPAKQRTLVNGAMRVSARKHMLPTAKQRALLGDGSGALSEALAIRSQAKRKIRSKGIAAGVELVPVRHNRKALAMYINHYYTSQGLTAPAGLLVSGIRHGHLVEFGSVNNNARPFLWPAAQGGQAGYVMDVGKELAKATERAVNRARKTK